ncbi:MazG nucleotide pyrophosphohydrolase domain-containing protein [Tepidibacter hydrothermalis]|uniref:MazG nucleotide pyrophosphohydrolase domain-containing protein n=1 Tax=Tepidibacter hydrothermalis TaxID=3036126 RepID=A0ABY8EBQ4_9FIRM|nr:MazG nucleotide pyrophosphohydrolase domain-containing protein [Tepidibacter hydrothermalis]WFD10352.1 MazG nucleotide pyrophosphohydrolase domain-containing protein [Tepidibacter hydrothermalis]
MNEFNFDKFENSVNNSLIRHKSILDIITKLEESNSKTNRAIIKSVTNCGCIEISGKKQNPPKDITFNELSNYMDNHISGDLCDNCKEKIEEELGNHLFYIAALCKSLNISLEDVLKKENNKLQTLGIYNLL